MNTITQISSLENCNVFHKFKWTPDLSDFGKYNLIYGWNGTGKTTLSRLLRNLELRQSPNIGSVELRVDGTVIKGGEFPRLNLQVRVFNNEFIKENVFPIDGGNLPFIFVVGADSVEKQKKVENLKQQLSKAESKLDLARTEKTTAEKAFDRFNSDCAKTIKDKYRSSAKNPYNNYDKSKFKCHAIKILELGTRNLYLIEDTKHDELHSQLNMNPKLVVKKIGDVVPECKTITERVSKYMKTSMNSAVIEILKNDPELANWSHIGLKLHQKRKSDKCQFCEQPLPVRRLKELEAHFNNEYKRFIEEIDRYINTLNMELEKLKNVELPDEARLYDIFHKEYGTAKADLIKAKFLTENFLAESVKKLMDKKSRMFESIQSKLEIPEVNTDLIESLNDVIEKHNEISINFDTFVTDTREKLAMNSVACYLDEFSELRQNEENSNINVKNIESDIRGIKNEISRLELEIIENRRPAEELNKDLKNYFGHQDFSLAIKETGYVIMRGNFPARSLSEGETTAIALLYFLKTLADKQFTLSSGIVVLDDPVSSLDANALFFAFSMIRNRTEKAGQLFVLTHNFSFFKQVRNWFKSANWKNKGKINAEQPAHFYMLESSRKNSTRNSIIRMLDPLLEDYDSDYHYLFTQVYEASKVKDSPNLEQNYVLPNIARRMLECFLAFHLPHISDNLSIKLNKVKFNNDKKLRIHRFLNTYSHSAGMGELEHDPTVLSECSVVLKDLLEMIKTLNKNHYHAMVKCSKRSAKKRPK